ncbi:MAG: Ig-like domain-containing protein [Gemmatimonadales bacterium]
MVWLRRSAFAGYTGTLYTLVLLSGCGSGTEPNGPANITLAPPSLSFSAIGQTQQLSPTVTDQQGNAITDAAVTWTTSNPGVAGVSSSGVVTAAGNGSAEVTATAGSAHTVAEVTVSQTPAQVEKNQGDGQTVVAGQPVPTPPSVLVTDANHNPVPAVDVTFQVTSGRGQVTTAVVATDNSGIAQVGGWSPGSKGSNSLTATAAGAGISGNPVTFTATGTSAFDIEVQFLGSATASQRQAFTDAAERWESLVTGDLENIPLQTLADDCGEGSPALNQTIDDLLIFVSLENIDGPGGVLGSAGPCFIRNSNDLSVLGAMIFDKQDLANIEDAGLLQVLIVHEMGHVLGFGSLWPTMGLLADPSLPPATGTDPHFTGAQAITAFNQVGGNAYNGAKVPVENNGEEGTADGHWRESIFINELMTGFVDLGENPLSVVSVSSLADQGYVVNKVGADPFSLTLSLRAMGARHRLQLGRDVLRLPIKKVDRAGRVTGYLRR